MDEHGQVALITLLVLTIGATIGLSLIARSTTDVGIARRGEESSRAFSAAEAGIEVALKAGISSAGDNYEVTVSQVGGGTAAYIFPNKTTAGETETVWLVPHDDGNIVFTPTYTDDTIDVCWSSENVVPALAVSLLYRESTDATGNPYRVVKTAVDPDTSRAQGNHFSVPTATTGGCGQGTSTTYKQTITFSALQATIDPSVDTLVMVRLTPLYSDALLAAMPVSSLPVQGDHIESVGETPSGLERKIIVYRLYTAASSLFDAAVFSQRSFSAQ